MKKILFLFYIFLFANNLTSQTQIDDHLDRTGTQLMNMTNPNDIWVDSTYLVDYAGETLKDIIAFLDSTIIDGNYNNPSKDGYFDIISFVDMSGSPDSIRVLGSDTTYVDDAPTKTNVFFEEYWAFSNTDTNHVFRTMKPPQNYTGIDTVELGYMTISNVSGTARIQVLGALFNSNTSVPLSWSVLDQYNITVSASQDSTYLISQRTGTSLANYATFLSNSRYGRLRLCVRRTPGHESDNMSGSFLIRDLTFKYD